MLRRLNLRHKIVLWATIILIIVAYPSEVFSAPRFIQAKLENGVVVKVHLPKGLGEEGYGYARQVLQQTCAAYREIVFNQGFNRPGYTFAQPTRLFAYDSDKVIDVYIADVEAPHASMKPQGALEYKACIYVPEDYKRYRKRYKIDQPDLELKASLTHELFHIITYSYNRNMEATFQGKATLGSGRWDWYTEGLARYFESLVGYREEFLSSGYRKRLGEKIMVYKGGVNYFLRYPDKPLDERKYDFALFWQYLHQNYGMEKIEQISSKFRQIDPLLCSNLEAMEIIAQTLGVTVEELWQDFSLNVYRNSSLQGEKEDELKAVSISKLSARKSEAHSICAFGLDYYEVDLGKKTSSIQINSRQNLNCLAGIFSAEEFKLVPIEGNNSGEIKIAPPELSQGNSMIILLSNPTDWVVSYKIDK